MKLSTSLIRFLALAGLAIVVVCLCLSSQVPTAVPFKPLTAPVFTGLIAWLFAVALFVERANEVVVMFFRDQEADVLDHSEALATELAQTTTAAALALASNTGASQAERDAAAKAVADARQKAADAHEAKLHYRAETKQIALLVGFFFGALVSLAGVRALQGLVQDNASTGNLFSLADIMVTSAMLAGGSEGIHRMANVFTSFMDSLSTQIDQKSKSRAPSA